MDIISTKIADINGGVALDTQLDGENVSTYVVTGVMDLEAIADIVPSEKVDAGAEIHVTLVEDGAMAEDQVDQVLENLNPGDAAVFLCADDGAYEATLDLLGLPVD